MTFRIFTRLCALLLVTSLIAACGGGDDETASTTATSGETAADQVTTTTDKMGAALEAQTFDVGEDFWHSGFHITVESGEVIVEEDELAQEFDYFLNLNLTLENVGDDTGYIDTDTAIATTAGDYPGSVLNDLGDVGPGLTSEGELTYVIDENFNLAGAELIVGGPDVNQARIPLTSTGEVVRLKPRPVDVTGTLSLELIDLVITSAELRYDVPANHSQVDAGKLALTLSFDAISRKTGNWQIFATDLALILPDGTAIAPDGADIGSLPGSALGATTPDRYVRFIIDGSPAGTYELHLIPGTWFVGEDGVTETSIEFTISE